MKNIIFVLFISVCSSSFAQMPVPKQADLNSFLKTTTLVIIDENNTEMMEFYESLKASVEKYWKITPYEFISLEDFDVRKKEKNNSYLMLTEISMQADDAMVKYNFISLLLGSTRTLQTMPELANAPLSYYGLEEETFVFKVPALVMSIQNHINVLKDNPNLDSDKKLMLFYHKNIAAIKGMVLYVAQPDLAPDANTADKIKTVYPYECKIISYDELSNMVKNPPANAIFLHKMGPAGTKNKTGRCTKMVMGASDAKLYYFDYHDINDKNPDGFMLKDFKKLSKND